MKTIYCTFFLLIFATFTFAQHAKPFKEVDQNELIKQTQKSLSENKTVKLIWWIPIEFWQVIYSKQPNISEAVVGQIVNSLNKYTFVGIVDGQLQNNGTINYTSETDVRKNVSIIDSLSKVYKPIKEDELESTTRMMLNTIKPVLQNMLGNMGDHFYFIAFENKNSGGNALLNPYNENGSRIHFYKDVIDFNVPISSLIGDKTCPKDKKPMNGTWKYCPFHGVELTE